VNHFKNALRKSTHLEGRRWSGSYLPVEVLALVKEGAVISEYSKYWVSHAELQVKAGDARAIHLSFEAPRSWNLHNETLDDTYC